MIVFFFPQYLPLGAPLGAPLDPPNPPLGAPNPPDPPLDPLNPPLEKPPLAPPAALGGLKPYWFNGALFLATDGFYMKNETSLNSNGSAYTFY